MKQQGGNVIIEKSILTKLIDIKDLNKIDYMIVLYLITKLDTEALTRVTYREVCDRLCLERSTVETSFKKLIYIGVLEKGELFSQIVYKFIR